MCELWDKVLGRWVAFYWVGMMPGGFSAHCEENATRSIGLLSYQSHRGNTPAVEDYAMPNAGFLFLSVLMVSVFSFVSIAVWTDARRKERESYYKAESMRRLAEIPAEGAQQVIEVLKEAERIRQAELRTKEVKMIEGMKIGGLVNIAVGIALGFMIRGTSHENSTYLVGLIPGLIGVALLVYALFMAPKPTQG